MAACPPAGRTQGEGFQGPAPWAPREPHFEAFNSLGPHVKQLMLSGGSLVCNSWRKQELRRGPKM